MKKYLLLFVFIVFFISCYSQVPHAPGYINTAIESQTWDFASNSWISENNNKDSFYYHFNDTLSYYDIVKNYNTNNNTYSNNHFQSFYSYTPFGKEEHRVEQQWNIPHGAWWNIDQYFFSYDERKNQVNETQQLWDTTRGAWFNYYRRLDSFDLNNNDVHFVQQTWDSLSLTWRKTAQSHAFFDSHNNDTLLIIQNWDTATNTWVNNLKDLDQYDNAYHMTDQIQQTWNKLTGQWVNSQRTTTTYNTAGNITAQYSLAWYFNNVPGWDTTGRSLYTYNANGQMASITDQYAFYTQFGHGWNNQDKVYYYYDAAGNFAYSIFQIYFSPNIPSDFLKTTFTWALAATALPITFLDFKGTSAGTTSQLQWRTATEINSSYFEIQRSTDNTNFIQIGRISAYGTTSNSHDYSFTDNTPKLNGTNYYRLKQVDKDGKYSFSKIIAINFHNSLSVQVFPNPATDFVIIRLNGETGNYKVTITDADGKIIWVKSALVTSTSSINVPLNNYSVGAYFIEVRDASSHVITMQKIIKK